MKKLLICTAATLLTVAAFAQGNIVFFSNSGFEKISSGLLGSAPSTWTVVPTTAGLVNYGLFYGVGATQPRSLTFLGSRARTAPRRQALSPTRPTAQARSRFWRFQGPPEVRLMFGFRSRAGAPRWALIGLLASTTPGVVLRRDHRHQRPPSGAPVTGPDGALAVRHRHEPAAVRGWLRAVLGRSGGP